MIEASHFDRIRPTRRSTGTGSTIFARTSPEHATAGTAGRVVSGIPRGAFVQVVREDPVRRGLLFAGTEIGVFVSFDDGEGWQSLQQNLPICSVRDIDVHGDDVVIATHGRGFWILDDVSPLRQLSPEVEQSGAWLFSPEPAVRVHPGAFQGTPLPKDEPIGENRPRGAFLDYWIGPGASGPVTLEVLDSAGDSVRRFSSSDSERPPDLGRVAVTPDWIAPKSPLPASPGPHRIVWDLHTATLPGLSESEDFRNEGLWVPPGRYKVRLEAGGKSVERVLEVRRDPRIAATDEDLIANFKLSREVQRERLRVAEAEREAVSRRKALDGQERADLDAIVGTADEMTLASTGGDPNTLQGASTSLRDLAAGLESADSAPSADDLRGTELRIADAERLLGSWNEFRAAHPSTRE